jgi:uncharacterized protein (TIGR00288 family)
MAGASHAALLIDFDNVTMGMRSDLSKDLKKLLQSDIIKGKVTVQRAYADWRRYPQYIVPLSEASIDLIFAPAYGSNKKNATDIRMAIDGMELVFTRPEIGTFILLTGDSDFSSLVLKLKEYGKYVIGVGIQESSSDILVQNCDEYYSYTSLTGLRKTTDSERSAVDPWILVEKAINRMAERDDVMRSDRLKQVMIEMDPNFDEGDFGYSKFSRFLSEAASKGLVKLTKLENGQYEVGPAGGGRADGRRRPEEGREARARGDDGREGRGPRGERDGRGRRGRDRQGRERGDRPDRVERGERAEEPETSSEGAAAEAELERAEAASLQPAARDRAAAQREPARDGEPGPLSAAYELLRRALAALREAGRESIRDSDLKRKMLELDNSFDEAQLGFGKFTRFLRQAHDHEIVNLQKQEGGNYEVSLGGEKRTAPVETSAEAPPARPAAEETASTPAGAPAESIPSRLGPRRGSGRKQHDQVEPSLFDGQIPPSRTLTPDRGPAAPAPPARAPVDVGDLGLPTAPDAQIRYLTGYRGVGRKTAEALVEGFGENLFGVLLNEPKRLETVVPAGRAEQVLEAWKADYLQRTGRGDSAPQPAPSVPEPPASAAGEPEDQGNASGDGENGRPEGKARRRSRRGGRKNARKRGA